MREKGKETPQCVHALALREEEMAGERKSACYGNSAQCKNNFTSSSSYGDLPVSEHFFSSLLCFLFRSCFYLWQRLGLCVTMVNVNFFPLPFL